MFWNNTVPFVPTWFVATHAQSEKFVLVSHNRLGLLGELWFGGNLLQEASDRFDDEPISSRLADTSDELDLAREVGWQSNRSLL